MIRNESNDDRNKTERIANKNKRVVLIASFVFPPLGYWLLGKRKYGLLCLFTVGYFLLGFLLVPIHTRLLINRAQKVVGDAEIKQRAYHRHYGRCPDCGGQMLRKCGHRSVVCESCGERFSENDVEYLGILRSISTDDGKKDSYENVELTESEISERVEQIDSEMEVSEIDDSEISDRVDRIESERHPAFGIFLGGGLAGTGLLLSLTGIGAIIGVPLFLFGGFMLVVSLAEQTGKTAKKSMTDSVWKGTELSEAKPGVVRHRKVNKTFGGRCVICGEFASLRDVSGKGISNEAKCKECGACFEREDSEDWRLVEGDDDRIGERKEIAQWKDELRERELNEAN